MAYRYKRKDGNISHAVMIIVGTLVGFGACMIFLGSLMQPCTVPVIAEQNVTVSSAQINLPAVDQDGNGVVTPLIVQVIPGDGKVLANIEKLLFWTDTQQSIQIANMVAADITGLNLSNYDLTYTVESDSVLIGGPSAGSALAVATIAALEKKSIRTDVMMTGTLDSDGRIGEVGGILEKATAAKDIGVKTFLVPKGQGTETYYKPVESCVQRARFQYCTTVYNETTVNISEQVGIEIVEVSNIQEALKYFQI